jgi:hypothetical protein
MRELEPVTPAFARSGATGDPARRRRDALRETARPARAALGGTGAEVPR